MMNYFCNKKKPRLNNMLELEFIHVNNNRFQCALDSFFMVVYILCLLIIKFTLYAIVQYDCW